MLAFFRWIIALPFIVGAILFALKHPEKVSITFNPFSSPLELPLYFVALVFLGIGFLLGALIAWMGMSKTRKDRRTFKKENKKLLKENKKLEEEKIETQQQATAHKSEEIIEGN